MANAAQNLRKLLEGRDLLVCPVIGDPMQARLVERAGLPMALLGGFGIAAMRFALPDTGLISFTEVLDQVRNTCAAVPGFPVVADGDTGYGNAMNVRRTVAEFARAGAAAILIEDQVWPKKCGHYGGGRPVIPREEARMKIRAAVEARAADGADILIMARTDARSSLGFEEAMARCHAFEEEGADIVFAEALETRAELERFAGGFRAATWANMMPKTPVVDRRELQAMGFKVVTYNVLMHAAARAVTQALGALAHDNPAEMPELLSFAELTALVGLPQYDAMAERYRVDA
ncbi:MAG TPA: isocitrate lyase/PEP mutase family protein [Stellaceae bacterium]|nr:isocitrate lyase/PEP mutase family protein [Stellaceae bacterium]